MDTIFYQHCNCIIGLFQQHLIDGPLLLRIDEIFARENLNITHALHRRKLMRAIELLKKNQVKFFKVRHQYICFVLTFTIYMYMYESNALN